MEVIGCNVVEITPSVVGAAAPLGPSDPLRLILMTAKKWPSPVKLSVQFIGEGWTPECKRKVLDPTIGANAWGRWGNPEFVETQQTGDVRVSRGPGGYWSVLGTDIRFVQAPGPTMNLQGFTENVANHEYERVVIHEFGHTLGFHHEHLRKEIVSRIDPEKAYTYFKNSQGWSKAQVDGNVLTPLPEGSAWYSELPDVSSIMCYQLPGSITKDGLPIPGGRRITKFDGAACNQIYPGPRLPPPGPPPGVWKEGVWCHHPKTAPARLWWWNSLEQSIGVVPYPGFDGGEVNYTVIPGKIVVTGAGAGGGPHAKGFDWETGRELWGKMVYAEARRGGIFPSVKAIGGQVRFTYLGNEPEMVVELDPATGREIGRGFRGNENYGGLKCVLV